MKVVSVFQSFSFFYLIVCITSCAPTRFVKPLNKNEQAVNLSLGGPVIGFKDISIPVPFVTATYGYGVDSALTAFGSLNVTSAFYGNAQIEIGIVKRIVQQHNSLPGISITPVANIIYRNKDASKVYPQVDINAYWDYNKGRNFFYAGLSNWFELSSKKAYDIKQDNHWFLSPMIGEYFVRKRWSMNGELKIVAANIASQKTVADYKTPLGNNGALGIYVGYTKKFK
ncbi:MAG: hypothetical protein ABIN25_02195 [Ginsengibacter sp.]